MTEEHFQSSNNGIIWRVSNQYEGQYICKSVNRSQLYNIDIIPNKDNGLYVFKTKPGCYIVGTVNVINNSDSIAVKPDT